MTTSIVPTYPAHLLSLVDSTTFVNKDDKTSPASLGARVRGPASETLTADYLDWDIDEIPYATKEAPNMGNGM